MLTQFASTFFRARRNALHVTAVLGLVGLAAVSSARAVSLEPASVVPGDTFSYRVVGYNTNAPASNIYLTNPVDFAFGTTQTYANYALNGQSLTVSSTEYLSGGTVVDFFSFSVTNNYVPAGTRDNAGNILNAIQFSIGNYLGGNNPLNLNPTISNATVTGSVIFINNGIISSGAVPMTTTLTGGNALSSFGAVFATPSTADISNNGVVSFNITVTYAVPEPSTNAAIALGAAGMLLVVVRRRRSARI